jgi:NAD(P)H-flavin reductase/ferredoxin
MFGFLKAKPQQVTLVDDNGETVKSFTTEPKETVLNAALREGIDFPYSCKVGGCASCKCQLVSGKVKELTDKSYLLSAEELQSGYILGCQSIPKSELVVRMPEAGSPAVPGTLTSIHWLTHDIAEVHLNLDNTVTYRPGQYASVAPANASLPARCYSFAHAVSDGGDRAVSFFVRKIPGGNLSHWLTDADNLGKAVTLSTVAGDCTLREDSSPIVCLAGGSGLSPIVAILEGALKSGQDTRPVQLLFGARRQEDLYYLGELNALGEKWRADFTVTPVLSDEPQDSDWQGKRGWLADAITAENAAGHQAYLCGPPVMIDTCMEKLKGLGIAPAQIFFDRFSDQSEGADSNVVSIKQAG